MIFTTINEIHKHIMTFTTGFVGLDHETGEDSDNKRIGPGADCLRTRGVTMRNAWA